LSAKPGGVGAATGAAASGSAPAVQKASGGTYAAASQAYRNIIAKSRKIRVMLAGADLPEHEFICLQMHLVQRRAIKLFLRYLRHAAARERL
jgi:hypothetical protein